MLPPLRTLFAGGGFLADRRSTGAATGKSPPAWPVPAPCGLASLRLWMRIQMRAAANLCGTRSGVLRYSNCPNRSASASALDEKLLNIRYPGPSTFLSTRLR